MLQDTPMWGKYSS